MATCANCDRELQPAWKYCITCGTRTTVPLAGAVPSDLSADPEGGPRRVNVLAVLALILGCLLSPFAALFGHIAVWQIKTTGERGLIAAWIAVVLGYIWLVTATVLVIAFVTTNA
jgi:uncharacterized Tic20 family protein